MRILVVNCGSATLKYKLLAAEAGGMQLLAGGVVEVSGGYRAAVARALETLPQAPEAIAHRVVHGGDRLSDVVGVDIRVLNQLRELSSLAPLHNGPALEGIEATIGAGCPSRRRLRYRLSSHTARARVALCLARALVSAATGSMAGRTGP